MLFSFCAALNWFCRDSSEKTTLHRLDFSNHWKVQVSPVFQDTSFGCPWDFPIFPGFKKLQNWNQTGRSSDLVLFFFLLEWQPPRDRKVKKKESNLGNRLSNPTHMCAHIHIHTHFFGGSLIITFGASTLFYLSGKKICFIDQELPVSLLSLKRPAEHFAPGNLRAWKCWLFTAQTAKSLANVEAWDALAPYRPGQDPPIFLTQHSCIL